MSEDEQSWVAKASAHFTFSPPVEPPMAMMVSRADREWVDQVRARHIELAYARGHIRRG